MNQRHILSRISIVLLLVALLAIPAGASPPICGAQPVAAFTSTGTSGIAPLTVQFTDTSLNSPTSWNWNFGDGESSTSQNPSHSYTAIGNYTVTLIVHSSACSDSQAQKTNYVTVTPTLTAPPQVTGITPATGFRNMTVSFVITGSGFVPGYTTVGIRNQSSGTLNPSVTSVTATKITGTLAIPADAVPGSWNVLVTIEGRGNAIGMNLFTVTNASSPPQISSITPAGSWLRNTTVSYSVAGTNFETGRTTVAFRNKTGFLLNGSSGAGVTLVTATMINGTIHIPADASSVTPYNLTVTTQDGGTAVKEGAVMVAAQPVPAITAIAPAGTWNRNTTVPYSITGTGFEPGATTVVFQNKSGLTVESNITRVTATRINGTVIVPFTQALGPYNITITTIDGGMAKKDAAFSIGSQPAPVITALTPSGSWTYGSLINYTITGSNFEPGSTTIEFINKSSISIGTGGTVTSMTSTRINGTISVGGGMPIGPYNLTMNTVDGGTRVKEGVFTIIPQPAPVISSVTPSTGVIGTVIPFTITGSNFQDGGRTIVLFRDEFFGAEMPGTLTSVSSTKITGTVVYPNGFPTGTYDIDVITSDGGTTTKTGVFVLNSLPTPIITSISPPSGVQSSLVNFTITGNNFESDGNTLVFIYNPVYMIQLPADMINVTGTTIRGSFVIPPGFPSGLWDVQVLTLSGGTATKAGAFTITTQQNPSITSITPVTGTKNSTVGFTIKGTSFPTLATPLVRLNNYADGTSVYAVVSTYNGTVITGYFLIPYNATPGMYRLDMAAIPASSGSKANAFTITNVSAPQVTAITPTTAYRNRTFIITVTGSNFQQGNATWANLSTPTYGTEIPLTLINLTPTRFNGTVTIPADVPLNAPWKLNITTVDGGRTTKTAAITITSYPAATIASITPSTGFRNTTVLFTITGTNFQTAGGNDTFVWFWNSTSHAMIVPTIYSRTATLLTGSVALPANADPAYSLNVSTIDGGTVMKANSFTTTKIPAPIFTSITPSVMYRGTTNTFTLQGSNFQNSGRTFVNLTNTSGYTVMATIWNTYPSTITGTATIPSATVNGSWYVNITTINGGATSKAKAVSIL
jgi:PKD repeat protein